MNEAPEYIANELRNPAWKDHCLPAAVELMQHAAVALEERTEERDACLADVRQCEQLLLEARTCLENEQASSRDLERLQEMLIRDLDIERAENEHLRAALNRIAMSPFSSEAARGIAAVALQVPREENAVANPAAPGAAEQHSADSRTASGVTGRRDGQPTADCGCAETYPQLVPGKVSHGPGCALPSQGGERG